MVLPCLLVCGAVQLLTACAISLATAAPLHYNAKAWTPALANKLRPHGAALLLHLMACLQWLFPSRSLAPVQAAMAAAASAWLLTQVLHSAMGPRKLDKTILLQPQMVEVAMAVMAVLLGTFKAQRPVGLALSVAAATLVYQRWGVLQAPSSVMRMVDAQKARGSPDSDQWHPALRGMLGAYRGARAAHVLACCMVGTGMLPGSDSHLSVAAHGAWLVASLVAVVAVPQAMLMHLALTQHAALLVARHVDGKQKAESTGQRSAQPINSAADAGYCVELQQLFDCDATVSHEGEVGMRQLDSLLASCLSGIPEGDEASALMNTHKSDGGLSDMFSGIPHTTGNSVNSDDGRTTQLPSWGGQPARLSFDLVNKLAPRTSEALRMPHARVPVALLSVGTQTDSPRGSLDRASTSSRRSIGFLHNMAEQLAAGASPGPTSSGEYAAPSGVAGRPAAAAAAAAAAFAGGAGAAHGNGVLSGSPLGPNGGAGGVVAGGAVDLSWQQALLAVREHASHIAHDLKNPLNGVLALSQTIAQGTFGALPQTCASQLEVVRACAYQLLNMVNMLRDLMRGLNLGDMGLSAGECMVMDHINEAITRLQPMAAGALKVHNLTRGTDRVLADNDHLYQVIHVVVANAFKFTRRGEVTFVLEPRDGGAYAVLRCTDAGTGFSQALQDKFNAPFTGTMAEQLGLGLLMVKRMMCAWGGQLRVHNVPPPAKGAVVELVFRANTQAAPLSLPPTAHGGGAR